MSVQIGQASVKQTIKISKTPMIREDDIKEEEALIIPKDSAILTANTPVSFNFAAVDTESCNQKSNVKESSVQNLRSDFCEKAQQSINNKSEDSVFIDFEKFETGSFSIKKNLIMSVLQNILFIE